MKQIILALAAALGTATAALAHSKAEDTTPGERGNRRNGRGYRTALR